MGAPNGSPPPGEFIVEYVRRHGDERHEVPAAEVIAAGEAIGYTEKQLVSARHRAGSRIYSRRAGRYDDPGLDGWLWGLAENPDIFDGPDHPERCTSATTGTAFHEPLWETVAPSTNGEARKCACENALVTPEALTSGKCKPCRDKEQDVLMKDYR